MILEQLEIIKIKEPPPLPRSIHTHEFEMDHQQTCKRLKAPFFFLRENHLNRKFTCQQAQEKVLNAISHQGNAKDRDALFLCPVTRL